MSEQHARAEVTGTRTWPRPPKPLPAIQGELSLEDGIQARFEAFHRANPDVYRQLVRIARELKRRGSRRASMDYLLHILRWNTSRKTGEDGFKFNDHWSSRYARLMEQNEPELRGFFQSRRLRSN